MPASVTSRCLVLSMSVFGTYIINISYLAGWSLKEQSFPHLPHTFHGAEGDQRTNTKIGPTSRTLCCGVCIIAKSTGSVCINLQHCAAFSYLSKCENQ